MRPLLLRYSSCHVVAPVALIQGIPKDQTVTGVPSFCQPFAVQSGASVTTHPLQVCPLFAHSLMFLCSLFKAYSPCSGIAANCTTCGTGFYGADCAACPGIVAATEDGVAGGTGSACSGHGTCEGSGSVMGNGTCACVAGWGGENSEGARPATL